MSLHHAERFNISKTCPNLVFLWYGGVTLLTWNFLAQELQLE